jgi:hypothetical protein
LAAFLRQESGGDNGLDSTNGDEEVWQLDPLPFFFDQRDEFLSDPEASVPLSSNTEGSTLLDRLAYDLYFVTEQLKLQDRELLPQPETTDAGPAVASAALGQIVYAERSIDSAAALLVLSLLFLDNRDEREG